MGLGAPNVDPFGLADPPENFLVNENPVQLVDEEPLSLVAKNVDLPRNIFNLNLNINMARVFCLDHQQGD